MIVLKHLAREFKVEPYKLRQKLRKQFGNSPTPGTYRKWKWESNTDPDLVMIRNFLTHGDSTSTSAGAPTPSSSKPMKPTASALPPTLAMESSKSPKTTTPKQSKKPNGAASGH